MSTSAIVTVWCDGCGTWAHCGNTSQDARANAKASGWAVALPAVPEIPEGDDPNLGGPRRARDYCPDCRTERGI